MPIDPNIPLQGRFAQIEDPTASMQKVVSMRNLIQQAPLLEQQNQIAALQLKQQQEDMKDQETLGQIYNEKNGDLLETRKAIIGKVSARTIMQFDQSISNHLKDLAGQAKAKIDLDRAKSARLGELANGMVDGPTYFSGIKQAAAENVLDENEAQQALSLGFDPDTIKHWQRASLSAQQLYDIDAKDRAESRAEATAAAELPGKAAESAMKVQQLAAMKNTKPEDWNKVVDAVAAPAGPTKGINLRTKSLVQFSLSKGDFKTAQAEIDKARDEVSSIERTQMGIDARKAAKDTTDDAMAEYIADDIEAGLQPPTLTGMYSRGFKVRGKLAQRHFDLATATLDWIAVSTHMKNMQAPQQIRLRQAVDFAYDSLPLLERLYDDWTKTGLPGEFKDYNKLALEASTHLSGENGKKAQTLQTLINDMVFELAQVYAGGHAATNDNLKLAMEQLKGEWNPRTFKGAVDLLKDVLKIRRNSIRQSHAIGMSPTSRYQTSDLEEENPFPEEEK